MKQIRTASVRYLAQISRDGCLNATFTGKTYRTLSGARNGQAFIAAARRALEQNQVHPESRATFREDLAVYSDAWKALSAA